MVWLYKHLNNETIADILIFFVWLFSFEVLCFIFIVEKERTKFWNLIWFWNKRCLLLSAALW